MRTSALLPGRALAQVDDPAERFEPPRELQEQGDEEVNWPIVSDPAIASRPPK